MTMKSKTIGLVGEIQKSKTEILRITAIELNGRDLFDIRAWYATNDGAHLPTKKGITISPAILPALIHLLQKAHQGMSVTLAKQEQH